MPELLMKGELRPIREVSKKITGRRPSKVTIWRWIHRGVNGGNKLDAVPCLDGWRTTEAAFRDFLARRAQAATAPHAVPSASDADLIAAGLL